MRLIRYLIVAMFSLSVVSAIIKAAPVPSVPYPGYNERMVNKAGATISTRFNTPEGYVRDNYDESSFGYFLRNMALLPAGSQVHYFNGGIKANNGIYEAVIDLPIGDKDLHKSADAVMHLWAEYLYKNQRFNEIHFNYTNGFYADYSKWIEGERIRVDGDIVTWYKSNRASNRHEDLDAYLENVYSYASTMSLSKEMVAVEPELMKIGDVFIQGGHPGHAVIVVDIATNEKGQKVFMLAQSAEPSQEIQIISNPSSVETSPWYHLPEDGVLITPEWTFQTTDLKTFEYIDR